MTPDNAPSYRLSCRVGGLGLGFRDLCFSLGFQA